MVNKLVFKFSFVANINMEKMNIKNSGFGRNQYEALKTALFNLIEDLLQNEKFIDPIKESLKIFLKNIKEPKNKENMSASKYIRNLEADANQCNTNINLSEVKKKLEEALNKEENKGYCIVKELSLNILSSVQQERYKLLN